MKRIEKTDLEFEMGFGVLEEPFSMDQYTAHLDRGWELLSKGNYLGARASVESVFELDEESPEAFTLQGAVFWGEGNLEAAVQSFESALEMEPDYVEAMVYLAEALSQDTSSTEEALDYLRQVRGLVEEEMPAEALVLEAELLWTLERQNEMKSVLAELEGREDLSPHLMFRVGRIYFEDKVEDKARGWLERSVEGEAGGGPTQEGEGTDTETAGGAPRRRSATWSDGLGDAHYYLGFLAERAGGFEESLRRFLITREMDLRDPRMAWSSSQEHFALLVQRAVGQLLEQPEMKVLERVTVIPLDYPPAELVLEGADPRMPVYLSSRSLVVAMDEAGRDEASDEGDDEPESIEQSTCADEAGKRKAGVGSVYMVVYQRNVERLCRGPEDVLEALSEVIRKEVETFNTASQELQERGMVRSLGQGVKVKLIPSGEGGREDGDTGEGDTEGDGEGEARSSRKGAEV